MLAIRYVVWGIVNYLWSLLSTHTIHLTLSIYTCCFKYLFIALFVLYATINALYTAMGWDCYPCFIVQAITGNISPYCWDSRGWSSDDFIDAWYMHIFFGSCFGMLNVDKIATLLWIVRSDARYGSYYWAYRSILNYYTTLAMSKYIGCC